MMPSRRGTRKLHRRTQALLVIALLPGLSQCREKPPESALAHLFVAASAAEVVETILERDSDPSPRPEVRMNVAASSTLARQIAQGAPVDAFLSAHPEWSDSLIREGLARQELSQPLLSDSLVIVAPPSPSRRPWNEWTELADAHGYVALGDPEHVPVGTYARQALQEAGLWEQLRRRVIATPDDTAARVRVQRGESEWGITYRHEALRDERLQVVAEIPSDLHPPIRYTLTWFPKTDSTVGEWLRSTLTGSRARDTYRDFGFSLVDTH